MVAKMTITLAPGLSARPQHKSTRERRDRSAGRSWVANFSRVQTAIFAKVDELFLHTEQSLRAEKSTDKLEKAALLVRRR